MRKKVLGIIPETNSELDVLLTIGIPTFNRPQELQELLSAIEKGVSNSSSLKIEVLISDNKSVPSVENLVSPFLTRNPQFQLVTNGENIGYDRNIDQIFSLSRGKYVLIISDDDRIDSDHFLDFYSIFESATADIILFESVFFDAFLKSPLDFEEEFFQHVGETKYYESGEQLLSGLSCEIFGGITGFCMKRGLWNQSTTSRYFGTNWIHLGVLLENLEKSHILIVRQKYFDYRMDNKGDRWPNFNVNFGIFRIYLYSGMLNYDACRLAFNKYKEIIIHGSLTREYKYSDRLKVLMIALNTKFLFYRVFTLKDFAKLLISLTFATNFMRQHSDSSKRSD